MKTFKLMLAAALFLGGAVSNAQSVVMEENFQGFTEQGWRPGADTLACGKKKTNSKTNLKISKVYGDLKVTYGLVASAVSPTCEAKKSPAVVSAGYVEVNKKDGCELTVGVFPYVSKIEVGASATGDMRGYALMKSTDGGKSWSKVGEYFGAKSEGQDAQYGFNHTINVNAANVTLKFVPTPCGKEEPENQTFRVHDIKVYGK